MFDGLKNLGGMMDLLKNAKQIQEKMQAMQQELGRKTVTADAGAGMVSATVNGRMELVKLNIDKSKMPDPSDTDVLEDVIVAAVNAAQGKAAEMMKAEMQKAAADMGLPPGMLPS